ncbi:hypothetical protein SESBI_10900 [Sesbania bispinosa]|nr:hypothetical protein SESBI_10900 [Sesbania bispinosa]
MARRMLKLAYISDEATRKATYRKRKKGILKKMNELTTLCGIFACAIIFNPFDSQVEVWPNLEGAKQVIERYKNTPVIDESKNVNQESFLTKMIAKRQDHLKKMRQDNREKELIEVVFKYMRDKTLPNMPFGDTNDLNQVSDMPFEGVIDLNELPYMPLEDANDLNKLIEKNLNEIEINLAKLNY